MFEFLLASTIVTIAALIAVYPSTKKNHETKEKNTNSKEQSFKNKDTRVRKTFARATYAEKRFATIDMLQRECYSNEQLRYFVRNTLYEYNLLEDIHEGEGIYSNICRIAERIAGKSLMYPPHVEEKIEQYLNKDY